MCWISCQQMLLIAYLFLFSGNFRGFSVYINRIRRFDIMRKEKATSIKNNILLMPQTHLGARGLIFFISLMGMFIPLSIDLYLPAMPIMTDYFQTTTAMVNLTLIAFYFFFAIGIILFGPISDRYGRKSVLITSLLLYTTGSAACALSMSMEQLIFFRVVQSLGAGGVMAISTALVKDSFSGSLKSKVLAVVQAMSVIAPMIAPIAGAAILRFAQWRETFWILTLIGFFTLIITFFFQETLPKKDRHLGSMGSSLIRLTVVLRNFGFTSFLIVAAMLAAPYMGYVTMSSYIYQNHFSLDAQTYSYFFAANSAFAVLGPVIYIRTIGKVSGFRFAWCCFGVALLSGICVLFAGNRSPFLFLVSYIPFTLVEGAIRPFSTSILLDQQSEDIGSASSLINAVQTILGSAGMAMGSLAWGNMVHGLGIIMISYSLAAIGVWLLLLKSKCSIKGLTA